MARLFGSATMANNDSTTDLGYGDRERQLASGFRDVRLTNAAIANDHRARSGPRVRAIAAHAAHSHGPTRSRCYDGFLVEDRRQLDHHAQAGGHAVDGIIPQAPLQFPSKSRRVRQHPCQNRSSRRADRRCRDY
jgi:hypothetical protein